MVAKRVGESLKSDGWFEASMTISATLTPDAGGGALHVRRMRGELPWLTDSLRAWGELHDHICALVR